MNIADTAQWRLIVEISAKGLKGCLKNMESPQAAVRQVADVEFKNPTDLLHQIENAVYDHPTLLDDFEADVIITTDRYIFVPAALADNDKLVGEAFSAIFGATKEDDIMRDPMPDGYVCLYSLVDGLKPFLWRTFCGARISSHVDILAARAPESCVSVWVRDGYFETVARDQEKLLCAATRQWQSSNDIFYHILNTLNMTGLEKISLSGTEEQTADLARMLKEYYPDTTLNIRSQDAGLSVVADLCLKVRGRRSL